MEGSAIEERIVLKPYKHRSLRTTLPHHRNTKALLLCCTDCRVDRYEIKQEDLPVTEPKQQRYLATIHRSGGASRPVNIPR